MATHSSTLPGKFHGQRSLVGYSPWGHKESDMTKRLHFHFSSKKCLLISWLQSLSTVILEPKNIKSVTASIFSQSICHEVIGLDAMIFIFWMLSFKTAFSLTSFTLIKRLFSSSLFSPIRVISSAYVRLLIFLLTILIPICDSSSPAFCVMYSAYKLNMQGDSMQPWHIPFLILNQSIVLCLVLTVVSWPAYRFLRREVRWSAIPASLRVFGSLLWPTQSKPLA